MFGASIAAAFHIAAMQAMEQDFERKLAGIDPGVAAEIRKERKEAQEKARAEATIERRHQELCRAIERSGFWSILR